MEMVSRTDMAAPYWYTNMVHEHGGIILGSVNWGKIFRQMPEVLGKRTNVKPGEESSLSISHNITIP